MHQTLHRSSRLVVLSALIALMAAACGSDAASSGVANSLPTDSVPTDTVPTSPSAEELAGDRVVFVLTESGGCAMGGPNCARYEVTADGTVQAFRLGIPDEDTADPAATGQVDPALVQAWHVSVEAEDVDALRGRVGEGELTAAFDGVDLLVADPVADVQLSSVDMKFDEGEPVFATAMALAAAAAEAAPLDLEMR